MNKNPGLPSEVSAKEGYKKTKLGWIPKEWEFNYLEEISDITRLAGYEYSKYWKEDPNQEIIALRGYNIGKGKLELNDLGFISNALSLQLNRSKLSIGDIVYPCVGSIGNAAVITKNNTYHIQQNIAKITCKSNACPYFVCQYLLSELSAKEVLRFNATSSQPNVLVGSLRRYRIALPPLPEQKKIAEILSTWDKAIQKTEALIQKKEQLKKGLMQQLLTGKKRFDGFEGEWEEVRLGKLISTFSGGTPSRSKPEYYNGTIPWIKSGELNNRRILSTKEFISEDGLKNSSAKLVQKDTLLLAIYGATAGVISVNKIEKASINQAVLALSLKSNKTDQSFLELWFRFNKDRIVHTFTQGGQPNLSAKIVKSLKIKLPDFKEQQKIAGLLFSIIDKIEVAEKVKQVYEHQKKGLMQQLLTGKMRVSIN